MHQSQFGRIFFRAWIRFVSFSHFRLQRWGLLHEWDIFAKLPTPMFIHMHHHQWWRHNAMCSIKTAEPNECIRFHTIISLPCYYFRQVKWYVWCGVACIRGRKPNNKHTHTPNAANYSCSWTTTQLIAHSFAKTVFFNISFPFFCWFVYSFVCVSICLRPFALWAFIIVCSTIFIANQTKYWR